MRTVSAAVLAALASRNYGVHHRLLVEDPAGDMTELTTDLPGSRVLPWYAGHTIVRDIDQLADTLSLRLRRDFGVASQNLSIAPLMEGSVVNRDAYDDYAPRVDVGRAVALHVAIMAAGATPGAFPGADWHQVFDGWLDAWESASQPMELPARDLMAQLLDAKTEADWSFADPDGQPYEDVAQQFLDAQLGVDAPTIFVPIATGTMARQWAVPKDTSVGEAVAAFAEAIGHSIRSRWDDGTSGYRITMFMLDPDDLTPVVTLAAGKYLRISKLALDKRDVVNYIAGSYVDPASGNAIATTPVDDPDSRAAYGRHAARLDEGTGSPIDSPEEWAEMAGGALAALKDPIADTEVERLLYPFLEPGDVVSVAGDDASTDVPLITAIKALRDDVGPNVERTHITGRARPAGAYLRWRRRAKDKRDGTLIPDPSQATIESFDAVEVNTPDGQYTKSVISLGQHGARWPLYGKDTGWPTLDGLEEGPVDPRYLVDTYDASTRETPLRTIPPGTTRREVALALNSAGKLGDRASASVLSGAGGEGTEGPALEWFGAEPSVDRVRIFWVANATILADPGRYVVDVFRDSLIIALTVPAEDLEAEDLDAVPCSSPTGCEYFQFVWRGRLRDTDASPFPTVEYTAPIGQLWESFTL